MIDGMDFSDCIVTKEEVTKTLEEIEAKLAKEYNISGDAMTIRSALLDLEIEETDLWRDWVMYFEMLLDFLEE